MADPLDCALDLMRRLPPSQTEQNLTDLIDLVPDLVEDLLSAVDQPLKVRLVVQRVALVGLTYSYRFRTTRLQSGTFCFVITTEMETRIALLGPTSTSLL